MKHTAVLFFAFLMIFSGTHTAFAAGPDLSLESIQVTPASLISTAGATLTVVVKNVGTGPHKIVTLFFGGDEKVLTAFNIPMHNSGEHGVQIPALDVDQSAQFTFDKQSTLAAGTYTIQAKIWPAKPWAVLPSDPKQETNMNNNIKDVTFTIKAAPSNLPKGGRTLHKIPTGQAPSKPLD
ncbi:MAG: hypothetical protein C0399_01765 [Syntrophus sp. (in: bacteria)]|nr:hypothetical protein [Syntrophus sp. (in: bacteria)]